MSGKGDGKTKEVGGGVALLQGAVGESAPSAPIAISEPVKDGLAFLQGDQISQNQSA